MRLYFLAPLTQSSGKLHITFEVWGTETNPNAEGVLFGTVNMSFPPKSTAEAIAEAIWERALEIAEVGATDHDLYREVLTLLHDMEKGQG